MITAENLIVEGTFFVQGKMDLEYANTIKKLVTQIMNSRFYYSRYDANPFFPSKYLSISFARELPEINAHIMDRIKRGLGIITRDALAGKNFFRKLALTRDDLPLYVAFCFIFHKHYGRDGLKISVRSEPAVLSKIIQLNIRPKLDDLDYSLIIDANKQFINEVMASFGAEVIEEPSTIAKFAFTPTIEKLEKYGFSKIVDLLKECQVKIQKGNTEDGLTDLREAVASFVVELVKKTGNKPTDKVHQNLITLKEQGHLDDWSYTLIKKWLYDWLYAELSATVHRRKKLKFSDAQFVYSLAENILSFLSEKIVLQR